MATHSSILVWRILRIQEPSGLQYIWCKKLDMTKVTEHAHTVRERHVFSALSKVIVFGVDASLTMLKPLTVSQQTVENS